MEEKDVIIIVAVVAGSLFVIVLVGLIIFIVVQRRRKRPRVDGAQKDAPTRSRLHLGFGQFDPSSSPDGATGLNRPTNNFDRVVSNNYVSPDILSYDHHKSAAAGNLNKVLPPVPAKPKMSLEATGSFRGKENSGFVTQSKVLPAVAAKPKMKLLGNGQSRGKENSGFVSESKVLPAVAAKPKMRLLDNGQSREKENSGFGCESKVLPVVAAKPKMKLLANGSSRGKDNSGFVSDDSGYTTLDTTVRSADSSLYLSQKLKQDMDNKFKNGHKRIQVADSESTGPYAVIDILDLKKGNSRVSASGPWPSAGFPGTLNQSDVTQRKPPQTREKIYFELEKQSDISEDDSDCENSFDVAQSGTPSIVWRIGGMQETNV